MESNLTSGRSLTFTQRQWIRHRKSVVGLGGLLASHGVRSWMNTLDYRVVTYDKQADPLQLGCEPGIYVYWHEYMLCPMHVSRGCHFAMLISAHEDADILEQVINNMKGTCIRGSTNRGGAQSIRELSRACEKLHLTITPDGPRGPRRKMALGPVYLAAKLQVPLITVGVGYDRPWRAKSWDKFAMPRPFSRARMIVGPKLRFSKKLRRTGLEECRERVEILLNDLTQEAEAWATSGSRKLGEYVPTIGNPPPPPTAQQNNSSEKPKQLIAA